MLYFILRYIVPPIIIFVGVILAIILQHDSRPAELDRGDLTELQRARIMQNNGQKMMTPANQYWGWVDEL